MLPPTWPQPTWPQRLEARQVLRRIAGPGWQELAPQTLFVFLTVRQEVLANQGPVAVRM
jgi:hypothetical protein